MGSKKRSKWSQQKAEFNQALSSDSDNFDALFEQIQAERSHARTVSHKRKSCTSKNRYVSREAAEAAIEACAEHGTTGLVSYQCEYCKGWHLTSHPQ